MLLQKPNSKINTGFLGKFNFVFPSFPKQNFDFFPLSKEYSAIHSKNDAELQKKIFYYNYL